MQLWICLLVFRFFFILSFNLLIQFLQRPRTRNNNEPTNAGATIYHIFFPYARAICIATRIWTMELSHLIIIANIFFFSVSGRVWLTDDNLDLVVVCSSSSPRRVNISKLKFSTGGRKNKVYLSCVFRREQWIQFPYYISSKLVVGCECAIQLLTDQRTNFLLPKLR